MRSLEKAQEFITKEFYEKHCDKEREPVICCVGHTHIDCAWLWTLRVTEDKAVRSFSTVLNLMKQYPEYIFMSSQPQLYKFVKKNAPQVYEQIKERVKEERWETEGGMFVEADCNLASGEALVRQFMHGKKFFRDEFGTDNKILWLPDVFGYSAALPQIMQKCGIPYFMTTKISWNELNKMPYDTFEWEGIDGSRVLTHFIPTRDYNKAAVEGGTETEHFTTYNGYLNPSQMKGGWARYSQKDLNDEVLCSFGFGDGGGGRRKRNWKIRGVWSWEFRDVREQKCPQHLIFSRDWIKRQKAVNIFRRGLENYIWNTTEERILPWQEIRSIIERQSLLIRMKKLMRQWMNC